MTMHKSCFCLEYVVEIILLICWCHYFIYFFREQADIVFLQEVIPESAAYFIEKLPNYHCTFGNEVGYFVGILLKKSTVSFVDSEITEFSNTRMMRNLLKVNVSLYFNTLYIDFLYFPTNFALFCPLWLLQPLFDTLTLTFSLYR